MVGLQTLDLAIGVRVPASQPKQFSDSKSALAYQLTARFFPVLVRQRTQRLLIRLDRCSDHYLVLKLESCRLLTYEEDQRAGKFCWQCFVRQFC